MMLVSHMCYSQYPMIKKIGKDSIILMTPNQGATINKKYTILIDTIKKISFENKNLKGKVDSISKKNATLSFENNKLTNSLNQSNNAVKIYKDSLQKTNSDFLLYKKKFEISNLSEKRLTIWGITSTLLIWISIVVFSSINQ